jgi:hypothetical protein
MVWACANAPYCSTWKANIFINGRNYGLSYWWILVVQNGPPVPEVIIFRARSERMDVSMIIQVAVCIKSRLDLEPQIDKITMTSTSATSRMEMTPPTPAQIPVSTPPLISTKCHFRSCAVVGPNVSRMIGYAPLCDQVFHSFCYDMQ